VTPSHIERRAFLVSAASGAVASLARPARAGAADVPSLVIDCHAHIYSADERAYPTLEKPYRPPAGKGYVAHLRREMRASGVTQVTAIQTTTFYGFDNSFLADSSRQNRDIMGGVCILDPDDPSSPELLASYVRGSNVRGMRSVPARSGRLDDPGVKALWAAAERLGIVVNVLAGRDKAEEIEALARRHPSLRVVIDHCFGLKVGAELEPTLAALERLARLPRLYAKLTFIPSGSAGPFPCRDMHEPCRRVVAAFGPGRCVWGSCFPCELWNPNVTYAQHLAIFTRELGLGTEAKKAILGETARRLWFTPPA
jgi:predicted TIM-barrel fold metal-dependent hydrolase